MFCYISTKNEKCNFLKSLFMASVSFISEQPSYNYTIGQRRPTEYNDNQHYIDIAYKNFWLIFIFLHFFAQSIGLQLGK